MYDKGKLIAVIDEGTKTARVVVSTKNSSDDFAKKNDCLFFFLICDVNVYLLKKKIKHISS